MYPKLSNMLKVLFILSLTCLLGCLADSDEDTEPDTGSSPLILTSYLEQGHFKKARELAKVTPDFGEVLSYSGYFNVKKNKTCDNNMFFWLYTAEHDWHNKPVIVWLQGGPGSSSMFGLFEEIGPFDSVPEGLEPRPTTWTKFANVLFLDSPVGVGYSYSIGDCYPTSISEGTDQLFSGLHQFFQMFHILHKNDLYLAGESFAGHYIPALANLIDQKVSKKNTEMNLKGIVLGNPQIDLECHDYGSYLYQVGIADANLRDELYASQTNLKKHIKERKFIAAHEDWDHILNELIAKKAGLKDHHSLVTLPDDPTEYQNLLNLPDIQKQLHVGSKSFVDFSPEVYDSLRGSIAQSSEGEIQKLLHTKKYLVAIFSGNMDVICMYTSVECVLRDLKWPGRQNYNTAPRSPWFLHNKLVGWFKTVDNLLLEVAVKDAQHAAIHSHPEPIFRMMESIVTAEPEQNPLWALQTSPSKSTKEEIKALAL